MTDDRPLTRPSPAIAADPAALGTPRLLHDGLAARPAVSRDDAASRVTPLSPDRVAVISNARSHRNKRTGITLPSDDLARLVATPRSPADLSAALAHFAAEGIDLLVIDGGDGTVRDVITAARAFFGEHLPRLAIAPSGKTNALAIDLGLPEGWTVRDAILAAGAGRSARRAPIEITRAGDGETPLRGFLFGAGAFVRATRLAQRTHRAGAFKRLAVGLSLTLAIGKTMFGRKSNIWRAGERMVIETDRGAADRAFYMLFGATLERLPLGFKPFGRNRPGLKLLAIDAPPRAIVLNAPALLAGSESETLREAGYHRCDPASFRLTLAGEFILDGEHYPGGALHIATGTPIDFVIP